MTKNEGVVLRRKKKKFKQPKVSASTRILFSSVGKTVDWMIFKIMAEFVEGFDFLKKLKKEVSIFGSARCDEEDPHYKDARKLGKLLSDHGYTVITGGGPGIMEAANRGAKEGKGKNVSIGLNIMLPNEQRMNSYVERSVAFDFFFTRKVMLTASSQVYVFFPGGYGTFDELFQMLTLVQTKKIHPVKIILMGQDFWKPVIHLIENIMYKEHNAINKEDMKLYYLAKNVDDAFRVIKKSRESRYLNQ